MDSSATLTKLWSVPAWLGLLSIGAPVIVHLSEAAQLSGDQAPAAVAAIADGIARATHRSVAIDDVVTCHGNDECAREIAAHFGSNEIVLVKLVGALRIGRAVAALATPEQGVLRQVQLEYSLDDRGLWPSVFQGLGAILFPSTTEEVPQPSLDVSSPPPPDRSLGPILSWTAIGTSVALTGTGIGLRVGAQHLYDGGRQMDASARHRASVEAVASNVMFGSAAVALTAGLVYLLTH